MRVFYLKMNYLGLITLYTGVRYTSLVVHKKINARKIILSSPAITKFGLVFPFEAIGSYKRAFTYII